MGILREGASGETVGFLDFLDFLDFLVLYIFMNNKNVIDVTFIPGQPKKTGHILITHSDITGKSEVTKIETSNFYMPTNDLIGDAMRDIVKNNDDAKFIEFQQKIRCVDIQKDAKIKPSVLDFVGNNNSIIYSNTDTKRISLDNWKDKYKIRFETITKKETWTRLSKGSKLGTMLNNRIIFKETGLSPEDFIERNDNDQIQYVGNIANEVIDPAGRTKIDTVKDIRFPKENITLKISHNFFNLFGFDYSNTKEQISLQSTYRLKYNYTIIIGNTIIKNDTNPTYNDNITQIVNTNKKNGNPKPIGWFPGNIIKNTLILQKKNISEDVKKAFFITKELGDVLQVLIMLIWTEINKSEPYSMVTNDHVVFFLCMILQLNCILTPGTETKKEKGKVRTKLQTIHIFEPSGNTTKKAIERFIKTKDLIYKENSQFIKCLKEIRDNRFKIYVSGIDNPFEVDDTVYEKFITDLSVINGILIKTKLKTYDENDNDHEIIMEIDQYTSIIKNNFTFYQFIKLHKSRIVIYRSNFLYTNNSTLWIDDLNPSIGGFKYGKSGLFELIQKPKIMEALIQTGGILSNQDTIILNLDEDNKNKALEIYHPMIITTNTSFTKKFFKIANRITKKLRGMFTLKSIKYLVKQDYINLTHQEYLEFPDKAEYYDKSGNKYNLYDELEHQVQKILGKTREKYFVDVYGLLLHYFYLTGNVLYDDELKNYINKMFIKNKVKLINNTKKHKELSKIKLPLQETKNPLILSRKRQRSLSPNLSQHMSFLSLPMDISPKSKTPIESKRPRIDNSISKKL